MLPPHRPSASASASASAPPSAPASAPASAAGLHVGARVRARYSAPLGARWYGGVVEAGHADGTYRIKYDDGDVEHAVRVYTPSP